jgi:hypothetical protein
MEAPALVVWRDLREMVSRLEGKLLVDVHGSLSAAPGFCAAGAGERSYAAAAAR